MVAKILRPSVVGDVARARTLASEETILRKLNHPGILRCFDAVLEGPRPHLVLEYIDGPRLSTLLRNHGALAIEQTIPLGLQLCSALHYMHRRDVLHLDVKPRNIIMAGPPRLIDLSVARTFEEGAAADQPIGTDAYMAPEQCDPMAYGGMGPAADIWGWAATMYEGLTGTRAFARRDDDVVHPQLTEDAQPLPDHVPSALADIVHVCLRRNTADRPSLADVAETMETLIAALPTRLVLSGLRPGLRS